MRIVQAFVVVEKETHRSGEAYRAWVYCYCIKCKRIITMSIDCQYEKKDLLKDFNYEYFQNKTHLKCCQSNFVFKKGPTPDTVEVRLINPKI